MGPMGVPCDPGSDPLQIWPFFKLFVWLFTSGLWKAFFSPIALVVINKWGVKLCICNFLFCFCSVCILSDALVEATASPLLQPTQIPCNATGAYAKAREVWCCTVFGVKPLQSLLQSESQAGKRCVEVICNWLKMDSKLVRISCFDAWYWEILDLFSILCGVFGSRQIVGITTRAVSFVFLNIHKTPDVNPLTKNRNLSFQVISMQFLCITMYYVSI